MIHTHLVVAGVYLVVVGQFVFHDLCKRQLMIVVVVIIVVVTWALIASAVGIVVGAARVGLIVGRRSTVGTALVRITVVVVAVVVAVVVDRLIPRQ